MTLRDRALPVAVALAQLAVIGFGGCVVASFVPVWPCSLFEHFRLQYVLGGVPLVAAAAVLAGRGWLDAALIAWLLELGVIAPDLGAAARDVPRDGVTVHVLLLNVHTESSGFEQVRRLIRDERPDIVGLVETDRRWLAELAPALADYPSRIEHPRDDNFGIAFYARRPVTGAAQELGSSLPSIVARVDLDGAPLHVIVTHPLPPTSAAALTAQERQLAAIAARARELADPVVVMGDLNTTPWSHPFARLRSASGTCDTRAGFGAQASFPTSSWLLRIPIDHVLASCAIGVRDRRIGPDVGSDHLPVIVDLVVPR